MEHKRRTLPRHVNGRIKIGLIPFKKFILIFIPIFLITVFIVLNNFTPITLVLGMLFISFTVMLISEFNNNESGIGIIRDILRYNKEGDIFYERVNEIEDSKKFIWKKK